MEAVHTRLWGPWYFQSLLNISIFSNPFKAWHFLTPFWQTSQTTTEEHEEYTCQTMELKIYRAVPVFWKTPYHRPFAAGASLRNLSLPGLEHLGSPLARANQGSILENVTSANLGSFGSLGNLDHINLTAIGSNFCHGTEQVYNKHTCVYTCFRNCKYDSLYALYESLAIVFDGNSFWWQMANDN